MAFSYAQSLNGNGIATSDGRFSGSAFGPDTGKILGPDGQPYRKDAPDYGFAVGHPVQFSALLSSGFRSYWANQHDEAMKHSREDARAMLNDCFLQALLQERQFGTSSLRWSIEIDDDRDPVQKAVQDGLTRIIRRTPNFRKLIKNLLWAIWYGRQASQLVWQWKSMKLPSLKNPKVDDVYKCLVVKRHQPVNGDKIGHHWDGTPYIQVNPAYASNIQNAEIRPTTSGAMGLYLRGSWRWRYIVHTHEAVDADYFDAPAADAIHGLGIRSVLFWLDWLRKEWLSNVADWCERTGLGIRLWYYQGNNPTSKTAVEKAARESNDRTNLLIPRYQVGANASEGVEFVDTSSTGADLLLRLQEHIEEVQERYVIGQSLSGGRGQGDPMGGEGKAKLARDTKSQIIEYDANNLGETLTTDLVKPIQHWTYLGQREAQEVNARLVFQVDEHDPDKFMASVKTFVGDLGGTVRESEVRGKLGFAEPQEGDKVISMETINKQKSAGLPQQPGMPGAPSAPSAPGAPPGAEAENPLAALMGGGNGQQQPPDASGEAPEPGKEEKPAAPGEDEVQKKAEPPANSAGSESSEQPESQEEAAGLEELQAKGEGAVGKIGDGHYQYLGKWGRGEHASSDWVEVSEPQAYTHDELLAILEKAAGA